MQKLDRFPVICLLHPALSDGVTNWLKYRQLMHLYKQETSSMLSAQLIECRVEVQYLQDTRAFRNIKLQISSWLLSCSLCKLWVFDAELTDWPASIQSGEWMVIQGTAYLKSDSSFGFLDFIVHLICSVEQASVARVMLCYYLAVDNDFFIFRSLSVVNHQNVLCLQINNTPYASPAYWILCL